MSMGRIKIGLSLNELGLPLRRALTAARRLGVSGVSLDAAGDFAPQSLSETGRRELRHLARSQELGIVALHCPFRRGLDVAENQERRIDYLRGALDLGFELGARLVTVQAGQVPDKDDEPRALLLKDALTALAQHGDKTGMALALVTGLESGATLKSYLDRFDTGSLAACFDPANLLIGKHDPYAAIRALGKSIALAHGTDARYAGQAVRHVPLGHGDIDWLQMLATLEEVEYRGWLMMKAQGEAEAVASEAFLRRLTG